MSNHARHHRRRRDRGPKIRRAAFVDVAEAARLIGGCDCPAIVTGDVDLLVVEHLHVHGCPSLEGLR